ncbi:hypothetical protein SAMD00023353_4300150 [Rosellinia necatrix]|uniref:Uncharacterized protein n=1 Tax=Rosellinia necatrix TaxID=77044 RepID=A0A1S8AAE4_ROSNE|nr:hypothetical protein SAMD00023353_4300150 [Rosellinia necatrix]
MSGLAEETGPHLPSIRMIGSSMADVSATGFCRIVSGGKEKKNEAMPSQQDDPGHP